jgi:hypothetical protein
MPGYPLLIALCKFLCGETGWRGGVFLSQLLMLCISAYALHRLAQALRFKPWVRRLFLFAYFTGLPFYFTTLILTDSIFASLGIISVCLISLVFVRKRVSLLQGSLLFLCLTLLCFWRESGTPFVISILFLLMFFCFQKRWMDFLKISGICLAVLCGTQATVRCWNVHRIGVPLFSSNLMHTMTGVLYGIESENPGAFRHMSIKDYGSEVRKEMERQRDLGYVRYGGDLGRVFRKKKDVEGIDPHTLQSLVLKDIAGMWLLHPWSATWLVLSNPRLSGLFLYSALWSPSGLVGLRWQKANNEVPKDFLPEWISVVLEILSDVLSLLVLLRLCACAVNLARKGNFPSLSLLCEKSNALFLGIFLQSIAYVFSYLVIINWVEYRYVLPSIVFIGFLGMWTVNDLLDFCRTPLSKNHENPVGN